MKVKDRMITCEKCGHKWKLSQGGKEPYKCACGHKNKKLNSLIIKK